MSAVIKPEGIAIDGEPVIILASSLFYFRVPRGLWRDRMDKIRQAGYNTLDVYFPWNYHELEENQWNFHGERDIAEFLHQAQDAGLWVIARPGPYICSEWDGGGLPAYLFTKPGLRIRDNDPRYLRYVSRWFDRVLTILEAYQVHSGGPIIAVQLENELDFFDCQDRAGYMLALRAMAREHDITVPLIACAGQGDLRGATGNVPGIMPTFNIYNADLDPGVEQRVYHLHQRMQAHRLPLLVTETNRSHFFLRRLLSAGAKLIGPYLQTGGVNFGFTQAVNNWGQPLAFLTSDYDFGGMIAPDGALRDDYREAQLLARMITAFGKALARAQPLRLPQGTLEGGLSSVSEGPYALDLAGGGRLLALPNLTHQAQSGSLHVDEQSFPCSSKLIFAPGRCPLLPVNLPLSHWNMAGTLRYATAEIALAQPLANGLALAFYADGPDAEISFSLPEGVQSMVNAMELIHEGSDETFLFHPGPLATARVQYPDGRELILYGLTREAAASAVMDETGQLTFAEPVAPKEAQSMYPLTWHAQPLDRLFTGSDFKPAPASASAPYLEEMGILRGYGWYHAQVTGLGRRPLCGYLLQGGADVLSLYVADRYLGTVTPGGGSAYLPEPSAVPVDHAEIELRAEIWGHSNFDDSRLPALRINSLRGLSGLVAVLEERDLTANWHINLLDSAENKDLFTAKGLNTEDWPLVSFAGWLSTRAPNQVCYRKHITAGASPVDRWVLAFPGLTRPVAVSVNGSPFKQVTPLDPYLDISAHVSPSLPVELTVYAEQDYHAQLAGRVVLLEGKLAQGWSVSAGAAPGQKDEAGVWAALNAAVLADQPAVDGAPVRLDPGGVCLLWADLPSSERDLSLRCSGKNVKLSVFFNGHLVGRIWPDPAARFPRFVGGAPDRAYLPLPWWNEQNRLLILVEAIEPGQAGEIGPFEIV